MICRSNVELLRAVRELVARVRGVTRRLLVELGELDARRLYLEEACPSMFAYCTTRLGFSEDVAYKRIQAARLGRRFPAALEAFGAGRIHLAGLAILGPHLTKANHRELLAAASGLTKRQIESLVADRFASAAVARPKGTLRRLRVPVVAGHKRVKIGATGAGAELAPGRARISAPGEGRHHASAARAAPAREVETNPPDLRSTAPGAEPSSPETKPSAAAALYRVSLTVGKEFAEKLETARAHLSHSVPDGDLARILELGLDALLVDKGRIRCAERARDRSPAKPSRGGRTAEPTPGNVAPPTNQKGTTRRPLAKASKGKGRPGEVAMEGLPTSKPAQQSPQGIAANKERRAGRGGAANQSRYISAEIRRLVWARDQGCCTFVDAQGRRCRSRWFLQIDHIHPYALGGGNTASNLRLLCGAHNRQRVREGNLPQAHSGSRPNGVSSSRAARPPTPST